MRSDAIVGSIAQIRTPTGGLADAVAVSGAKNNSNERSMRKPYLTVGMATLDDYDGVYFSVTSLMIHHAEVMSDCEFVVVDNNPTSKYGRLVRDWMRRHVSSGRYIPFDGPRGTAGARNEVLRRARGEVVLCIDCHVLLVPGAVQKLRDYFVARPGCRDLLTGPLISDSGKLAATHQEPKWSSGAWGVWSLDERGNDSAGEPFEIWQQGMGLFACRKDAWVGFHPEFRGFGGCESYVMEKFRRNGAKVLCCPWLRWTHRFQRPDGIPYRVNREDRLRNYVVGFQELGLDTDPVMKHFGVSRDDVTKLIEPKKPPARATDFAVVGDRSYVGVNMRGRVLSRHLGCELIEPRQVHGMARRKTIIAIKRGFSPTATRAKCDRLVYDPLDVFCDSHARVDPVDYWRSVYRELRFDDIIATSPACHGVMRAALPDKVRVHIVPHQCDPRIDRSWRNPDGPVVYAGLNVFVASGVDRIKQACRMIGKDFVMGESCDVLKGASLALAFRLPPYDTEMYRRCKPQIKLENAAAAGLPAVATDCPAATSLHRNIQTVPVDFSASQLAAVMQRALNGPGLTDPFTNGRYLAAIDRILRRETVVVYTAIFGGYDELREPRERMPGVQYVCFTDNPWLKSKVWDIRYCKPAGNPLFQAKRHKALAHEVLDCDISLWIDGRVELYGLNGAIERLETDIALLRHPDRNCIYAEASHCKASGRGDPSRIDDAIARYRAEGHPTNYGLWLGGVIFRRHTRTTANFNLEWWREVKLGTSRDQIILPVVLRRLGISFDTLPNGVPRCRIGKHAK
jgi:glycosyltransferase involved in cell wall biosynthesis